MVVHGAACKAMVCGLLMQLALSSAEVTEGGGVLGQSAHATLRRLLAPPNPSRQDVFIVIPARWTRQ